MRKFFFRYILITSYVIGFYLIFFNDQNTYLRTIGYGLVIVNLVLMAYFLVMGKSRS